MPLHLHHCKYLWLKASVLSNWRIPHQNWGTGSRTKLNEVNYEICSSVSIEIRLWARRPWFNFRHGKWVSLFATASRPTLQPTQPPMQLLPWALTPVGKLPGRKADHCPPSMPRLGMHQPIPPPSQFLTAWCLIKQEIRLHGVVL